MKDGISRPNANPSIPYSPFSRTCIRAMPIMAYAFNPSIPSYRSFRISTSYPGRAEGLLPLFPLRAVRVPFKTYSPSALSPDFLFINLYTSCKSKLSYLFLAFFSVTGICYFLSSFLVAFPALPTFVMNQFYVFVLILSSISFWYL